MNVQVYSKDLFTVPDSIRSLMMLPGSGARPKAREKLRSSRPSHTTVHQKARTTHSASPQALQQGCKGRPPASAATQSTEANHEIVTRSSSAAAASHSQSCSSAALTGAYTGSRSERAGSARRSQAHSQGSASNRRKKSSHSASLQKQRQSSAQRLPSPEAQDLTDYDEYAEQDIRFINLPSSSDKERQVNIEFPETPRNTCDIVPEDILLKCQEANHQRVYEINLSASEISQIANLESFKKLRVLDLSCNYIKVIDNLQYCSELRELKLYDNHIWEIQNLEKLKELCHLQLQHNRIKSIGKGLQSLRKLKQLRVDSNYIGKIDVRELAGCSMLTSLDLSSNCLDNIKGVSCLPNLEELYVRNNKLRGISDLSRCKKLQEVDFSYNRLTDVAGLKGLPCLTFLLSHLLTIEFQVVSLSHNQLTSLKSLGNLKMLQEIYASHNQLSELGSLVEAYPGLQILDVSDNCIEIWQQLCLLMDLPDLVELFLAGNPFCMEHCNYHKSLHEVIPHLEVLDGVHLQRPLARTGTPLMRPMTANSVVSARQVETQLKVLEDELTSYGNTLAARFESLRASVSQLPIQPPGCDPSINTSPRPKSRCGKRSRIQLAKEFAASQNFDANATG